MCCLSALLLSLNAESVDVYARENEIDNCRLSMIHAFLWLFGFVFVFCFAPFRLAAKRYKRKVYHLNTTCKNRSSYSQWKLIHWFIRIVKLGRCVLFVVFVLFCFVFLQKHNYSDTQYIYIVINFVVSFKSNFVVFISMCQYRTNNNIFVNLSLSLGN